MKFIPPNFHPNFRCLKKILRTHPLVSLRLNRSLTLVACCLLTTIFYGQNDLSPGDSIASRGTYEYPLLSQHTDTTFHNYPNPFTSVTSIHYSIEDHCFVQLKLFDRYGRYVKTLVSEKQQPGQYDVQWAALKENGKDAPSGMYFAKLWSGDRVKMLKIYLAEK